MSENLNKDFYTTEEIAEILQVAPITILCTGQNSINCLLSAS